MKAKALIVAAVIAGLPLTAAMAVAADQKATDNQEAMEDYLAAARTFLAEFDGMTDNPKLPVVARGLVRTCDELPVAQLPHTATKICADFEAFWQHEWPWKRYLQQRK